MTPSAGSILTLNYYGAGKVKPHHTVMGIAKAALERAQFSNAPQRQVGRCGGSRLNFLSDMSSGFNGELHRVDGGYHVVGMNSEDAPDVAMD